MVKTLFQFMFGLCLVASTSLSASGAFSSLYVFGDTLSATADTNPNSGSPGPPSYYGYRWSNGRVWVEVLAQRQGLTLANANNDSYWDHGSGQTLTDINNFTAPGNVANDLFIVWVCNADTFDAATDVSDSSSSDYNTLLNIFINDNIQSQANHLQIITRLYAKGVRTLIMPNAVDISKIPAYNQGTATAVLHAGCIDYNTRFVNTINQAMASCPGLQIYTPDYYTLLNSVLANPKNYGLSNVLLGGYSIDAIDNYSPNVPPLNGAANNYIYWDPQDPTAKLHEIIADVAQQIISPSQISDLTVLNGSNRLDVVNLPVGLNGFVLGCTNLSVGGWASVTNFSSTSLNQSIFVNAAPLPPSVPPSGSGGSSDPNNPTNGTYFAGFNPAQFYELKFPFAWSWP
jgi:phospholipase/lecithinase/hemolysin